MDRLIVFMLLLFLNDKFIFIKVNAQKDDSARSIKSFCTGCTHTCALFGSGGVKCTGRGSNFGQFNEVIGDEMKEVGDSLPFINFGKDIYMKSISCGCYFVCAVSTLGSLKCLGYNEEGQIGIGSTNDLIGRISGHVGDLIPYVNVGSSLKVTSVSLGYQHSCVKTNGNRIKCYGFNSAGQLGYGDTTSRGSSMNTMGNNLPYVDFGDGVQIDSIHSGSFSNHNCVILLKPKAIVSRIKCWGFNDSNQLGYGTNTNIGDNSNEMGSHLLLLDLGIESKGKQIAMGLRHTCILLFTLDMKCWGSGTQGQLGSGSVSSISYSGKDAPIVVVDSFSTIKHISASKYNTCIVYEDQLTAKCIGDNKYGQLGQGDSNNRGATLPTVIPEIPPINLGTSSLKILSIINGEEHTCILFVDSSVKCFGSNSSGQLAVGSASPVVGNNALEMGQNLEFSLFFSPTTAPTQNPTTICEYTSPDTCNTDINCLWIKVGKTKKCTILDCTTIYNKRKCLKLSSKCYWNTSANGCHVIP